MALRLRHILFRDLNPIVRSQTRSKSQRWSLGAPPELARNLDQRLAELNYKDPSVHYKVNIGFSLPKRSRREDSLEHAQILRKNKSNESLERLSRDNELRIPLNEVERESAATLGPLHCYAAAQYYSIFEHLFGDAYFYPVLPMEILYDGGVPVYRGNVIKPQEASKAPSVRFDSAPDSLWTLSLTTPDGLETEDEEAVHWLIGNIKGGQLESGDVLVEHKQPLPLQGIGYLRYIFILYKQEKLLDFGELKSQLEENPKFSTLDFYRSRQEFLTPAGLSFFTSDWDESVTNFYHKTLQSDCPSYVYDFPEHYYAKQKWFPLRQPFNLYLDRYRDPKQISKEHLVRKLKNLDPFVGPKPKPEFPNANPFKKGTPSWLKTEIIKERLGYARYKDE